MDGRVLAPARVAATQKGIDPARVAPMLLVLLFALVSIHATGAVLDFAAAVRSPLEIDYGEGIVWQQAVRIPGPQMYADVAGLPFIVFHYPPVYYLLARAASAVVPDMLAAGRLVSAASSVVLVPLAAALVLSATPRSAGRAALTRMAAAVAGLLVLCLLPVRYWGVLMRVDMPGLVFGMAGLLVASRADGRFLGTVAALLLCLLAVFTKQTLLSFGVAVFVLACVRRPLPALAAAGLVGAIGVAAVLLLQAETAGGFLRHIVGNNINRFSAASGSWVLSRVTGNLPLMLLSLLAGVWLARAVFPGPLGRVWHAIRHLREADPVTRRRALVLLHFVLSSLTLVTIFKVGSSVNYLLEWCCSGAVVTGVALSGAGWAGGQGGGRQGGGQERGETRGLGWGPVLLVAGLVAGVSTLPIRVMPDHPAAEELRKSDELVQRIAAAPLPVAAENMVLLMRSGRGVVFEPAIVTELAHLGRWDEAPLVEMIARRGFAFILTSDGGTKPTDRRTPAVNQAMVAAYPRLHEVMSGLWLREP